MNLEGKLVLLTGASGGIGEELAQELAAQGAHLLLHGRRGPALERLCKSLPHPSAIRWCSPTSSLHRSGPSCCNTLRWRMGSTS